MRRILLLLLFLAPGVHVAFAQDEGSADGKAGRDPFAPSERMRDEQGDRAQFVPRDAPNGVPALALRGFIEDGSGNRVALLEVEGGTTHIVRKGDAVNLPRGAQNLVVRVIETGNLELRVEIGELRRVVVVR